MKQKEQESVEQKAVHNKSNRGQRETSANYVEGLKVTEVYTKNENGNCRFDEMHDKLLNNLK
jgi:hypothetical protein